MRAFLNGGTFLLATALVLVAGCGGGGEAHTASRVAAATQTSSAVIQTTTSTTAPAKHAAKSQPSHRAHRAKVVVPPGPPPRRIPTPVPAAGDSSIQTYGTAPSNADFVAVANVVRAYDWALAHNDGEAACAALVAGASADLAKLFGGASASKSEDKRPSCAKLLAGMFARQSPQYRRQLRSVRVTDARLKGDSGFAIFHMPGFGRGFFPVRREGGQWKVAALAGSALP